jgi:hypothetical protein
MRRVGDRFLWQGEGSLQRRRQLGDLLGQVEERQPSESLQSLAGRLAFSPRQAPLTSGSISP